MSAISKHLIVIGGGAAGIFSAVNAARLCPDLKVSVLEKTGKLLSKVRISGGGRCNVTHGCYDITEMASRYPRGAQYVRRELYCWGVADTVGWFAKRGVELRTEADGRMFPVTDMSQTIIDCLMREAGRFGVEVMMHAEVKAVVVGSVDSAAGWADTAAGSADQAFGVRLADGRFLRADFVCVACGGYPKSGMFDWIRQLGHSIEEPVPSLFTFNLPGDPITGLMGVTVPEARVKVAGSRLSERGPLLITHWGFSGPVVLRLSAWGARELAAMEYRCEIRVNWLPEKNEQQVREQLQAARDSRAARQIAGANPFDLPQRLWEYWLGAAGIAREVRWADLPIRAQNKLVSQLCAGEFTIAGKTTFKEEFVTAGGVRLSEVDPVTGQSRKVPGLYFAGEILDVDGITGGYNFQHAWSSGWIVADHVAKTVQTGGHKINSI